MKKMLLVILLSIGAYAATCEKHYNLIEVDFQKADIAVDFEDYEMFRDAFRAAKERFTLASIKNCSSPEGLEQTFADYVAKDKIMRKTYKQYK